MWRNIINDQGSQFFVLTKLVPTLRCSQSMCNMKAFFHFLSYCLCQTDWWEFQLIPPTAHILGKLSVCQVSSNSSMRTTRSCATERHTQDLQPYSPWENCSLCWAMVMLWTKLLPNHQYNPALAALEVFLSTASPPCALHISRFFRT